MQWKPLWISISRTGSIVMKHDRVTPTSGCFVRTLATEWLFCDLPINMLKCLAIDVIHVCWHHYHLVNQADILFIMETWQRKPTGHKQAQTETSIYSQKKYIPLFPFVCAASFHNESIPTIPPINSSARHSVPAHLIGSEAF